MLAVALSALVLAGPPPATVNGTRLAVSSWCWASHCGAPIAASTRTIRASRGSTLRIELTFEATQARFAVAGSRQTSSIRGHEVDVKVTRSGGFTLNVSSARGWVIYVGRLKAI